MTAAIGEVKWGTRGRSGVGSTHRGAALFDLATPKHDAMLWVAYHVQGYFDKFLYAGVGNRADDLADPATQGAEPYLSSINTLDQLSQFDTLAAGRENDRAQANYTGVSNTSEAIVRMFLNTHGGTPTSADEFESFGPYWSLAPGWPTPSDAGQLDLYHLGFVVDNFIGASPGVGLIPRMRAAATFQLVGTAEATTFVTSPAASWDPDPMWNLADCLVIRGVIVPRDNQDLTAQGISESAVFDNWDWTPSVRPGRNAGISSSDSPGSYFTDPAFTGAAVGGADIPSVPSFYISGESSELVLAYTVCLGFGAEDETTTPTGGVATQVTPLHIPYKEWARTEDHLAITPLAQHKYFQNLKSIESWADGLRCSGSVTVPGGGEGGSDQIITSTPTNGKWKERQLHIPMKEKFTSRTVRENYLAIERWANNICPPLHIPYKDWVLMGYPAQEESNLQIIEQWARGIGRCCEQVTDDSGPVG